MKKSFKFLIVFFTIAIILCCSVFVSAAELKNLAISPVDVSSDTLVVTTNDNSSYYSYSVDMSSNGLITKYVEENPGGIVSPWRFYTALNFKDYNISVPSGYYLNISFDFYVVYSSIAKDLSVNNITTQFYSDITQDSLFYVANSSVPSFISESDGRNYGKVSFSMNYLNSGDEFTFRGLTPIVDVSGRSFHYMTVGFKFDEITISVTKNVPNYNKPSDSAITEQDSLTSELENQTAAGNEEANNIFNSFDGVLGSDSNLYRGLLAATTIVNEWLGVEWVSPIITFGLILGMFSFLLGSAIYFSNFASRKEAYNRRNAAFEKRKSKSKGS